MIPTNNIVDIVPFEVLIIFEFSVTDQYFWNVFPVWKEAIHCLNENVTRVSRPKKKYV